MLKSYKATAEQQAFNAAGALFAFARTQQQLALQTLAAQQHAQARACLRAARLQACKAKYIYPLAIELMGEYAGLTEAVQAAMED